MNARPREAARRDHEQRVELASQLLVERHAAAPAPHDRARTRAAAGRRSTSAFSVYADVMPWKNHFGKYVCANRKTARPSFQPSILMPPENGFVGIGAEEQDQQHERDPVRRDHAERAALDEAPAALRGALGEVRGHERLVEQERREHEEHRGPELEVAHPREALAQLQPGREAGVLEEQRHHADGAQSLQAGIVRSQRTSIRGVRTRGGVGPGDGRLTGRRHPPSAPRPGPRPRRRAPARGSTGASAAGRELVDVVAVRRLLVVLGLDVHRPHVVVGARGCSRPRASR